MFGRNFWRSFCLAPLFMQGHPGAGCTSLQTSFAYLQGERFHSLPGQPVPLLINPHRKKKKKVPDLQRGPSVFQFMPIASSPVTGHQWKEPGSLFLVSSLQIFLTLIRLPSEHCLFQAEESQLSKPFLIKEILWCLICPSEHLLDSLR